MSEDIVDSQLEAENNPDISAERPDWLPSNFKEPEALVKSYESAQAELTRAKQEAAAARAALEAVQAEQQQVVEQQRYSAQQNDLYARFEQAREMGDTQTELALYAYIAQEAAKQQAAQPVQAAVPPGLVARLATDEVSRKYTDFDAYKGRVSEYLSQHDYLVDNQVASDPEALAQRLETAYLSLKGQDANAGLIQQPVDIAAAKQAAQTMSGASVRQPAPDEAKAEWERIKAAGQTAPGRYY